MKIRQDHGRGAFKTLMATVVCVVLFVGLNAAYGFERYPLDRGVRDTMGHEEKVLLVMEEDKSLTRWQAEAIVAHMDTVPKIETYGVRGSFRANLSTEEKILLVMEEERHLNYNALPEVEIAVTRTWTPEPEVGLGYHRPYIPGKVWSNLSRAEKIRLVMEEDKSLPRWQAEARVAELDALR